MIAAYRYPRKPIFLSNPALDDQRNRRQLTNFALKSAVLSTGVALILEICYFFLILSDRHGSLLMIATAAALAFLAILLRLNQAAAVPHWFASSIFLLALTLFALICDTPEHLLNGRSTMFMLAPILLSGVLIHPYAPFACASWIVVLFLGLEYVTSAGQLDPLTIVFFYVFSGLVCAVLGNLAKSTFLLRMEAVQSETILSALRGGYVLTDRTLTILRMNERASDILPLVRVGARLLEVVHDCRLEISGSDLTRLTGIISGTEAGDARIQIAGNHYYVANKYIPATREHLIFLRDISAEVEIERLKDTVLAMASHELRTPLTAIRGQAELAVREPDTAVSNASRILVHTQRLLIMVENLLSQSRLRTGKIRNVPSPTNVETVFRVVYSLVATEPGTRGSRWR